MKPGILASALLATALTGTAFAQSGTPIKLADVAELSGGGATVGTNWKNGIDLAIEEINAKGGVLGSKLVVTHADSQSNPGVARAQVQKALDNEPYVLLGPGYSGSVKVTAPLAAEAGIAQIMGGEAAELTQGSNKFLFRTSFGQQSSMPKVAKYIHDEVKAKTVAIVWVNNDFGKGGRDVITKEFGRLGIKVAADISTEAGQADFAADVSKIKAAAPDGIDCYFENVGGEILDAALARMNAHSRIAVCGLISQYNVTQPYCVKNFASILTNRIKVQGFIVSDRMELWAKALPELIGWVASGKIKYRETVAQGLENAPKAFIGLLKGENFGKQLVKLA